ncbi:IGSF6 protein, partial [Centropus bengalensis]|nr:IGSF6 protein [Centropus bengalensis]
MSRFLAVLHIIYCLLSIGASDTCQVTVTQPGFQEAKHSMHTVYLTCTFTTSGCLSFPPQVLWFRFLSNKHEDLCTPACTNHHKYKVHFSGNNSSLQINDLTVDDNAVYICGVAFPDSSSPRSKQTGDGTVLKTTENQRSNGNPAFTFLIIASCLLFIYSTAIFAFFGVHKKISSGRKIFQAIAQELQRQRYAEHCQQP